MWTRETVETRAAERAGQVNRNDRVFLRVSSPTTDHAEVEITMLVQQYWAKTGDERFDDTIADLDARVDAAWAALDPYLEK